MHLDTATWEITRKCNLNCMHCFNDSSSFNEYGLSTKNCYKIIDKLDGIKDLVITGGEPLLRKDLSLISRYARSKFDKLILQTNGELIPQIDYELLNQFNEIEISIYGKPDVDKKIKQELSSSLEKSLEILKQENIPFTIATVLMEINKEEMDYLVEFSKDIGAEGIRVQDLIPFGRAKNNNYLFLPYDEKMEILNKIKNMDKNFIKIGYTQTCGGGTFFIELDCFG